MTNMKPYDPEHKGEFCTKNGYKVTLWAADLRGDYSRAGIIHREDEDTPEVWTDKGDFFVGEEHPLDLMCVIPKREARVIAFDASGSSKTALPSGPDRVNAIFREVMPDDISQEKARAVIEAARAVLATIYEPVQPTHPNDVFDALRTALGDDT